MGRLPWWWWWPAGRDPPNVDRSGSPAAAERSGSYRLLPQRQVDPVPQGSRATPAQHQARVQTVHAHRQLRGQLLLRGAVHFVLIGRRRRRGRARPGRERHPGGVPAAPQSRSSTPEAATKERRRRRTAKVRQFGRGHRKCARVDGE